MTQAQTQLIVEMQENRQKEARRLRERIDQLRKEITAASGKWDSVEALRSIRYGK